MTDEFRVLAGKAFDARTSAYAPYSKFTVGAAILCRNGRIFTGCNIENASYPAGVCAERVAIFKAISEGEREFSAIAVAGDCGDKYIVPCGICLQVLCEFCPADFPVLLVKSPDDFKSLTLGELLPSGFRPAFL